MARAWDDFQRITKTRKVHRCEITKQEIPIGSSCWRYVGMYDGDMQSWYCTDEAKTFVDKNQHYVDGDGFTCEEMGGMMRDHAQSAPESNEST